MAPAENAVKHRRGRRLLFRFGAVAFGLGVLLVFEASLRILGVGKAPTDPMVGFSEIRPLFVKNSAGDQYEIPESRRTFFQKDSFATEKGDAEYRIFCLGGSTVQGRPYSIETSFTTWLELSLQAVDATRDWQVVNCGGVSYASYRLVPILKEVLRHKPDLIIVYTGHNEFLEERSYAHLKQRPRWMRQAHDSVSQLRLYGLVSSLLHVDDSPKKINLPAEVDALLDYKGGLSKYHRDESWRQGVIEEFDLNLRTMVELAEAAGTELVLLNPVSNLRDTPPFKVEPPSGLSDEERRALERRWQAAKEAPWDQLDAKLSAVDVVLEMDDGHAEAHFLSAKVHEERGAFDEAKTAYLESKDTDVCPLRMLESMHERLFRVAEQTQTEFVDVRAMFEADAERGIPGDVQLIDHVHPRIEWHQRIADLLLERLVQMKITDYSPDWKERRKRLYLSNFESLPVNYFPESVARLRGLRRWTQGRVERLKLSGTASNTRNDQR